MTTDFAALTGKFRANLESSANGGNKINKRNRQPLSCAPCRSKKLKCDRGHPCETCIKKGDIESCTYGKATVAPSKSDFSSTNSTTNGVNNSRGRAQERLRHLEQLVMQMVDNNGAASLLPSNPNTIRSDTTMNTDSNASIANEGQFHLENATESRYVGSTHWSAILQNIQELKSALHVSPGSEETHVSVASSGSGGDGPSQPDDVVDDTTLDSDPPEHEEETLFAAPSGLTISHILSTSLPSREQVDRRLSTYFNSTYMVIPFIHTWEFQHRYEAFWANPLDTSPFWLSILFCICCMSATLSEAVGTEPPTPDDGPSPRSTFLSASRQCLRLGGLTRLKRFGIEAFALYTQCLYIQTLDPSGETALIWAMLVRQAYRGGYHRDSSHFASSFTVFEAEMRRRVWAMLRQFDLMISFQLGLPNQIPPGSWDTQDPRNLLDADFDESSTELPPGRPETEATQILYFIVKSRLMTSFGKVTAHSLSFRDVSQADVMALDREVRAVHATVPDILRIRPMRQSFADPAYLVMVRLNCEFLFQKSLCVLHRKYMTMTDPVTGEYSFPESITACVDAASAISRHMLDLHKEFKPGGQLYDGRWMLSSFTMNDFYLASIVLCLAVSTWKNRHPGRNVEVDADQRTKDVYALLGSAFTITVDLSPTSREARRVSDVLRVVLDGVGTATTRKMTSTLQHRSRNRSITRVAGSDDDAAAAAGSTSQRVSADCLFPSTELTRKQFGEWPQLHQQQRRQQDDKNGQGQQNVFVDVHEFNLTPLSLSENVSQQQQHQHQHQHRHRQQTQQQETKPTDDWTLSPNRFSSTLPFQLAFQTTPGGGMSQGNGTGGVNTVSSSSEYTSIGTTSSTSHTTNGPDTFMTTTDTNTNTNTNLNMNPMNMDIDWAFLDQWMAAPNDTTTMPISGGDQDWMNSEFRFPS
ncbi:uncharacterized protein PV06_06985 [Exophiala oligosperma]|uniref:Zn(2)-C6 fungal-type domain-containing protein n=1 Tax=Exophiala oligosperma TaxID=215243 RepID=A0A0D2E0U2_9EURO|nr:uncharacterized protein PV06_06985 [Exophiala oligosperma]KIW41424.1 hypothetical protein PV06_06985 [Exophiala oligosperma]